MLRTSNLGGSLLGIGIGILLVIGSPLAMWSAQSQHSAKDFKSAEVTESTDQATGYIKTTGTPQFSAVNGGEDCIEGPCIYQKESQQEFVIKTDLMCGSYIENSSQYKVIRQNGTECDSEGNCEPCYDVEKSAWEEQNVLYSIYDVNVGQYTVKPTQSTLYLDLEDATVETGYATNGNESRSVYNYFPLPEMLTVAGTSTGTTITSGEKTFVVSQYDQSTTLEKLKARDTAARTTLWVVTFVMLFVGILLILGPIRWLGGHFNLIPIIGPLLSRGTGLLTAIAAFIIAVPLWIVIFTAVVLIKAWWIALIAIALVALYMFYKSKQYDNKPGAKTEVK